MRKLIGFFAFFFTIQIQAQLAPDTYFIEFTDKKNSPFSIDQPLEFLSPRAVERRLRQSIVLVDNDLPVNPWYVDTIMTFGVRVLERSKWLNGIVIRTDDPSALDSISKLPFVKSIIANQVFSHNQNLRPQEKFWYESQERIAFPDGIYGNAMNQGHDDDYGGSYTQVHMIHADLLHTAGYRGEGQLIAILDAGFLRADVLPAFDSLWSNNQILGTRDFVISGNNVFTEHPHGMEVLSLIGGQIPGQLMGTAPKAMFWLLRSEDAGSEYLIEEYNWVCAAEFADSAGADVINSSLGYTTFNDPSQNHTCEDMTGNATVVTRGGNIAFSKGILVVNSAGNNGETNWQCMSAPADGWFVLGVGAVDSLKQYASFSSVGEVRGDTVKPNVVAMGKKVLLSASDGSLIRASGTSFSAPLLAGAAACLWQAKSSYSNKCIKLAIEQSASHYLRPDKYLGYGIPDFYKALTLLSPDSLSDHILSVSPNPFHLSSGINILFYSPVSQKLQINIFSMKGERLYRNDHVICIPGLNVIELTSLPFLSSGPYILGILSLDRPTVSFTTKIIKGID